MNSPSFANLTLRNFESSILEKQRCQNLLRSSNEALLTFTTELKRIKKVILAAVLTPDESMDSTRMQSENTVKTGGVNAGGQASGAKAGGSNNSNGNAAEGAGSQNSNSMANHNMDALLKRLMKFKHLEDDNKKLKNLLK